MDPRNFHSLAEQLAKQTSAAYCRTAISRAYYAAYNVGVQFLEKLSLTIPHDPTSHSLVREWLGNSGDKNMAAISKKLGDLYRDRLQADYHLNDRMPETQQNAQARVIMAKSVIDTLDKAAKDTQQCEKIEKTIKSYENRPTYKSRPTKW